MSQEATHTLRPGVRNAWCSISLGNMSSPCTSSTGSPMRRGASVPKMMSPSGRSTPVPGSRWWWIVGLEVEPGDLVEAGDPAIPEPAMGDVHLVAPPGQPVGELVDGGHATHRHGLARGDEGDDHRRVRAGASASGRGARRRPPRPRSRASRSSRGDGRSARPRPAARSMTMSSSVPGSATSLISRTSPATSRVRQAGRAGQLGVEQVAVTDELGVGHGPHHRQALVVEPFQQPDQLLPRPGPDPGAGPLQASQVLRDLDDQLAGHGDQHRLRRAVGSRAQTVCVSSMGSAYQSR